MRVVAALLAAGLAAQPARAAASEPVAPLAQPRLDGSGRPAQEVAAGLWWADLASRDAQGPATLADALRGVPGLLAGPAPGNGTAALVVAHGRAQPGVIVAGIALPGAAPLLPGLFDADLLLVEGPSGRAAGGADGAITLSLRRPGDAVAGAGEFAAGAFGSRRLLGRLDLPLASGVRLGIGGHLQHDLGWLANATTGERLNRGQRAGLSASLDVDLAPRLSLALTSLYARSNAGNLPAFACNPLQPAACDGRFASTGQLASPPLPPAPRWGPISADLARQPLGQRADLALHSARLAFGDERLSLTLAAAAARQTGRLGLDLADGRRLDALAVPAGLAVGGYGLVARTVDENRQLSLAGDARLGRLALSLTAAVADGEAWRSQADTVAGAVLADRDIRQRRATASLAAEARLEPVAGLSLQAGVRVARERLWLGVADRRQACAPCLVPTGPAEQRQTLVTPEFALGWRPGRDGPLLLFARSARTARLPGWNLLARTADELQALPAETGWHHEAGVKADLFGGRLRANASGFVARTRALVSPYLGVDPLAMAGAVGQRRDMANHGLDLVVAARPLPRLELSGSLGWQQARWRQPPPAGAPLRPLFAPDATASLAAAWRQPMAGSGAVLVPRVAARWRSRMAVAAPGLAPVPGGLAADGMAAGGWQLAAAVQIEIPGGGWLASLECDNCLAQALTEGAVAGLPTLNPPRWWQLRLTRRF